jgi:hypothetical protein
MLVAGQINPQEAQMNEMTRMNQLLYEKLIDLGVAPAIDAAK